MAAHLSLGLPRLRATCQKRLAPASGPLGVQDRILHNALHLFANAGATMGLGFVFWWLAARALTPAELGDGTALVSAMFLLGLVAKLGYDLTLVRVLPRAPPGTRALTLDTFATATLALGLALGVAFVALAATLRLPMAEALGTPLGAAMFVLGVAATGALTMLDGLFLSEERADLVTKKNAAVSGAKLLLLAPLAAAGGAGVAGAWSLASASVLVALVVVVVRAPTWRWRPRLRASQTALRASAKLNLANFAVQMAETAPPWLLPLVVTQLIGAEAGGHFYVAWMIASLVNLIPYALATAFLANVSRDADASLTRVKLRRALGIALALALPAAAAAFAFGPYALALFGAAYVEGATPLLRILVLAAPFVVVNLLWTARLRADDLARAFTLFGGGVTVVALLLIAPMHAWGVAGVGWAWVASNAAFALIAFPRLVRASSRPPTAPRWPAVARQA